jgi:hypothetical protein
MVMVIGKIEDKADISFQGEYNRKGVMDGLFSKPSSVTNNGKASNYVKIYAKEEIANSSNICKKGNKYVYKCTSMYCKPVRRVNMRYVNRFSTVCTQRISLLLERVQAQVPRVTLSKKSSNIAEKCVAKPLRRLKSSSVVKEKK